MHLHWLIPHVRLSRSKFIPRESEVNKSVGICIVRG